MIERFDIPSLKFMNFLSGGAVSRRLVSKGIQYLYAGNRGTFFSPNIAVGYFHLAIQVDPSNADAYTEFAIHGDGHVLLSEGEAVDALDKAIQANPKYSRAYLHRGVFRGARSLVAMQLEDPTLEASILRDKGWADESGSALNDYASSIAYNPDFLFPYYDRGCLLYMWGMPDKAVGDFEKVMRSSDPHLKEIAKNKLNEISTDPKRSKRFENMDPSEKDLRSLIAIENDRREFIISRNGFYWHFLREPGRTNFAYDPKVFQ